MICSASELKVLKCSMKKNLLDSFRRYIEAQHAFVKSTPRVQLPAIAISREAGSGAITIGHLVAKILDDESPGSPRSLGLFSSEILPRKFSKNTISRLSSSSSCLKTQLFRLAMRSRSCSACIPHPGHWWNTLRIPFVASPLCGTLFWLAAARILSRGIFLTFSTSDSLRHSRTGRDTLKSTTT
jgi:hypothetical protein